MSFINSFTGFFLQQYFVLLAPFLGTASACSLQLVLFPQESRQNTLFLYVILH